MVRIGTTEPCRFWIFFCADADRWQHPEQGEIGRRFTTLSSSWCPPGGSVNAASSRLRRLLPRRVPPAPSDRCRTLSRAPSLWSTPRCTLSLSRCRKAGPCRIRALRMRLDRGVRHASVRCKADHPYAQDTCRSAPRADVNTGLHQPDISMQTAARERLHRTRLPRMTVRWPRRRLIPRGPGARCVHPRTEGALWRVMQYV
ncbi:hypothetical protein PYCCODRAFT_823548 [Trametes coccinea BRFM310]|uniref:Uncharacterized protein n=1 Tax=Trametes coccinea (strain BRFM310) TaxID=1353009 RepID=A0A1Y2IEX8_TRAC3|nr:hypothetical protein PYCCODRAFT_823548 [Trametes coccinea BRFM310]